MIRYALKCAEGHEFESWFQSASAYDRLGAAGRITCPHCGTSRVEKTLMAPQLSPARSAAPTPDEATAKRGGALAHGAYIGKASAVGGALTGAATPAEAALAALRQHIETTADYVGSDFAVEARRIHDGEVVERPIWGEARLSEAKALIDDGIPVAPLPFRPTRKSN